MPFSNAGYFWTKKPRVGQLTVNLGGTFSFFIGVAIRFVEISSNSRLKKKTDQPVSCASRLRSLQIVKRHVICMPVLRSPLPSAAPRYPPTHARTDRTAHIVTFAFASHVAGFHGSKGTTAPLSDRNCLRHRNAQVFRRSASWQHLPSSRPPWSSPTCLPFAPPRAPPRPPR